MYKLFACLLVSSFCASAALAADAPADVPATPAASPTAAAPKPATAVPAKVHHHRQKTGNKVMLRKAMRPQPGQGAAPAEPAASR